MGDTRGRGALTRRGDDTGVGARSGPRVDRAMARLVMAGGVPLAACAAEAVLARVAGAGYYVAGVVVYALVCGLALAADGAARARRARCLTGNVTAAVAAAERALARGSDDGDRDDLVRP
jgi:1,4-dihydroxy-2-naphthoyl-CoA synthase